MLLNPFHMFKCRSCGTLLKTGLDIRIGCLLTFCAIGISFIYTFPILYHFIESHEERSIRHLLGFLLPLTVITLQVILFFIPITAYAWVLGRLEKAVPDPGEGSRRDDTPD